MHLVEKVSDVGEFMTVNDLIDFLTALKDTGYGDELVLHTSPIWTEKGTEYGVMLTDTFKAFVDISVEDLNDPGDHVKRFLENKIERPIMLEMF